MKDFSNKTIFITGGSSGIGLAVAKAFAKEGSSIVIFARTISVLENAKKEIDASSETSELSMIKQKVNFYSVDITNHADIKSVFEKAINENGIPYILVNCVGIAQPDYFEHISFEAFDKTIKTNLYSTWNACAAIIPYMKKNGGVIVNTSSIAGFIGVFGYTDYCMTKFGIIGFSDSLRQELAQYNIHVSVLCPPDTDTPGLHEENKTKPRETLAISGNAKLLKPEFVADAVLKGIQQNKKMIVPGADGKMSLLFKRFFPGLVDWMLNRTVKKVQKNN